MANNTDDKTTTTGTPVGRMEPQLRIVGRNPMRGHVSEEASVEAPAEVLEGDGDDGVDPNMEDNAKAVVLTNIAYNIFLGFLTPESLKKQLLAEQWTEADIASYLAEVVKYVTPLKDYVDQALVEQAEEAAEGGAPRSASDLLDRVGIRLHDLLTGTPDLQGMDLTISLVNVQRREGAAGVDMRVTIGLSDVGWEHAVPNFVSRASRGNDRLGALIDAAFEAAVTKLAEG